MSRVKHFCVKISGWTGLIVELVLAIEDRFGVEISDDVVERIEAVGDLIHLLEGQWLH